MRIHRTLAAIALGLVATTASAAEPGDVIQPDNLGMNMISWNLSKGTHSTVADAQVLSEFVGAHVYAWKDVRLGMQLQFSEQLAPDPKTGDRFRTFALLPQIGWNIHEPFFVAAIFTYAPRSNGMASTILGVQALGGVAFPVAKGIKLTAALEVPYNFYPDQTIGLTPLVGATFTL